jgi:hypothetical protein
VTAGPTAAAVIPLRATRPIFGRTAVATGQPERVGQPFTESATAAFAPIIALVSAGLPTTAVVSLTAVPGVLPVSGSPVGRTVATKGTTAWSGMALAPAEAPARAAPAQPIGSVAPGIERTVSRAAEAAIARAARARRVVA